MNTREFVSYYKKLRKEQDETIEYEEAREEIEEIFNLIAEVIAMDEEVKFKNKGTFSLLKRKKRRIATCMQDFAMHSVHLNMMFPQCRQMILSGEM